MNTLIPMKENKNMTLKIIVKELFLLYLVKLQLKDTSLKVN